jgi:hypothetical protein
MKSEVFGCSFCDFSSLCVSDSQVAIVAKEPANFSGVVAVIDAELATPMGAYIVAGWLLAHSADAALLGNHPVIIRENDPVTVLKF